MSMHIRDAGVWKEVTQPSVKDAGVWKPILEGFVRDAGVWKQFFAAFAASLDPTEFVSDFAVSPGSAEATFGLGSNGAAWGTPLVTGIGSQYEVFATLVSGSVDGGSTAFGSWVGLDSGASWTVSASTVSEFDNDFANAVFDITIRDKATATTFATSRVTIEASVEGIA